jgi:hypothetical protein
VPEDDLYEVQIYNAEEERQLVAVIEIASPANKDRVAGLVSRRGPSPPGRPRRVHVEGGEPSAAGAVGVDDLPGSRPGK